MSKLSFRARALDASKPMPIYLAEELPDLPDYSAINRAVPQMPSGMEKEEESEHHLQRAISGTGLIIPTPEVCQVSDLEFYERCYPPDYKMPKQHIHMQPLWEEQEAPEYDIDTEDERWLKQQRHPELTELKFEQMMDKLEKSSGQTVVTLNEAKLLLERNDDLVIAVYDYWLNKRLNTQHPLILSVKTENRPGQSSNNPYLAFRRRTEKMQTRKNRKNDESSYEKMLKLRRDLARALTLLELVAKRESAKRELVRLTALIAERRYAAGDFANQLLPEPPPRPTYAPVQITSSNFRREAYPLPHYPPRPPTTTPVDQPRQREKRPYKRRKHRHPAPGVVQGPRDSGVYTSSEEEPTRSEAATPPDDGPFAFRRKPGCYYEMPTSTLYGDPLETEDPTKAARYEHELDERHRYTLTSLRDVSNGGAPRCIGFARRRVTRGGRVALDRTRTTLHDLFTSLPFAFPGSHVYRQEKEEEVELETKAHRTPKEMSRDYHTSGKYPWRNAFRRHLSRHPDLWTETLPPVDVNVIADVKLQDVKSEPADVDEEPALLPLPDLPDVIQDSVKSDIRFSARTIDSAVRDNIERVMRKRAYSACSDSSYDSDESLQPVEKEFENFINEVNKKWLHFRPKTPPPSPPREDKHSDQFPVTLDTPITVELRAAEKPPSEELGSFTTSQFTLRELYPEINDVDNSGSSLDISGDDLLTDDFTGLTEAQVESILSETDLKALAGDDKKLGLADALLDELVNHVDSKGGPFLLHGQSADGRADSGPLKRKADSFGSTVVSVSAADKEPIYNDLLSPPPPPVKLETPKPIKEEKMDAPAPHAPHAPSAPTAVPNSKIIVEEVNEVPHIKIEKKRKDDTIEEVQLPHGVQLKTVQTKHSPLKKHIITSSAHRRASDITLVTSSVPESVTPSSQPQIVTVAVSDSLKVRLQNHLLSTQSGVLVQNGPFPPVVAVPMQQAREAAAHAHSSAGVAGAAGAVPAGARRVSAPLVSLAGVAGVTGVAGVAGAALSHKHVHVHAAHSAPLVVAQSHTIHHVAPSKLKVLHAHTLTQTQRTALLAQNRALGGLPAVVSLAALDGKAPALLKTTPGAVTQLFEIKSGQLGKGPHLVNVVRQPQPRPATDDKRRVNLSLDGRQLVMPVRQQIQLRNRPMPLTRAESAPRALVANLIHKGVPLQRSVTGVQTIAFAPGGALKAARARLVGPARAAPAPAPDSPAPAAPAPAPPSEPDAPRPDSLPMEVT